MGTKWAKEEIESVLIQLDNQFYPFTNYRFAKEQDFTFFSQGYHKDYISRKRQINEKTINNSNFCGD